MPIQELIDTLRAQPHSIEFSDVIATINAYYEYTPTRFVNGIEGDRVVNDAGKNEGSCRIFAFAQLNGLDEIETLACFGKYYREDVLRHPEAGDHANIRTFMRHGWDGVHFDGRALKLRAMGRESSRS